MKKFIKLFVGLFIMFLVVVIYVSYVISSNDRYMDSLVNIVKKNTDIKDVSSVNLYDNFYIVKTSDHVYVFNNKFDKVYEEDVNNLYMDKNLNLIYKSNILMYEKVVFDKDMLKYKYYDAHDFKYIKTIKMVI